MHMNHKSKKKKKTIVIIYEPSINLNRIIKKTKKQKQCHKSIRKNKISHRKKIKREMKNFFIGETKKLFFLCDRLIHQNRSMKKYYSWNIDINEKNMKKKE